MLRRSVMFLPQDKNKKLVLICIALVAICVIGLLLYLILRNVVLKSLVVEAGEPLPQATEFIIADGKTGEFLSGLPHDTSIPGVYPLTIAVGEKSYVSTLIVQDTIPPTARSVNVIAWAGDKIRPWDFVSDVYDATYVNASFDYAPDTSVAGTHSVAVLLTDAGGNSKRVLSELRIYKTVDSLSLQPGSDASLLNALSFVEDISAEDAALFTLDTDLSTIDFHVPGKRDVIVSMGNKKHRCVLDILDVTPPFATPLSVRKFVGDTTEPADYVTDIIDETPVTVSFVGNPDNMLEGEQTVQVLLTDAYGNTTVITSSLTLVLDIEPPVIAGVLHKTIFIGDTIAYRADITVTDNRDEEVLLKIDSSAVDTKTEGKYPVLYSATDACGNTAEAAGSVTVLSVTREQVYEMADTLLAGIINADMSLRDKAYAIYIWVRTHIAYINTSVKDDPNIAAYRGLKDKRGDCFVYASVAELLLTRAGIDNILIHRIPGARVRHYWSLVNIGEGWYHFDSTPHQNGGYCFMLTESQVQALARKRGKDYYTYDASLYPEVVQ